METIDLLLEIAEKSGLYNNSEFKTGILAKKLNVSQQTVSNVLRSLEDNGIIKREPFNLGIRVSITEQGRYLLQNYKARLDNLFLKPAKLIGTLFSGLGEGGFYVMQKEYKNQFKKTLKAMPFNGTLNLKVDPSSAKSFLRDKKTILIRGFKSNNRTYGALRLYPVRINNIPSAIIIPDRTHYDSDTLEVISEFYLREKLKLKDGDKVTITEA